MILGTMFVSFVSDRDDASLAREFRSQLVNRCAARARLNVYFVDGLFLAQIREISAFAYPRGRVLMAREPSLVCPLPSPLTLLKICDLLSEYFSQGGG